MHLGQDAHSSVWHMRRKMSTSIELCHLILDSDVHICSAKACGYCPASCSRLQKLFSRRTCLFMLCCSKYNFLQCRTSLNFAELAETNFAVIKGKFRTCAVIGFFCCIAGKKKGLAPSFGDKSAPPAPAHTQTVPDFFTGMPTTKQAAIVAFICF